MSPMEGFSGMEMGENESEGQEQITPGEVVARVLREAPQEKREDESFMEVAANTLLDTAQELVNLGKSEEEIEAVLKADLDKLARF